MVEAYCSTYHKKKEYTEGDRIPYAGRVYDSTEMGNLVDSALEFWLAAGHYTVEFEENVVMAVHTLENSFDLKAVKEFCDKHNLWLIEDNSDALGTVYTNNPLLHKCIRSFRDWDRDCSCAAGQESRIESG